MIHLQYSQLVTKCTATLYWVQFIESWSSHTSYITYNILQLSYIPVCILFSSFFNLFYSCLILWHTLSMFKKWQSHLSLQHYLDIFRLQMGVTKRYLHCRLQQSRMPAMVKSGKATSPSVRRTGFGFSGWWTSMATFLSTSLAMTPAQATPECAEWNEASLGLWAWRNRMIQRWVRLSTVGMSTAGGNNCWQKISMEPKQEDMVTSWFIPVKFGKMETWLPQGSSGCSGGSTLSLQDEVVSRTAIFPNKSQQQSEGFHPLLLKLLANHRLIPDFGQRCPLWPQLFCPCRRCLRASLNRHRWTPRQLAIVAATDPTTIDRFFLNSLSHYWCKARLSMQSISPVFLLQFANFPSTFTSVSVCSLLTHPNPR